MCMDARGSPFQWEQLCYYDWQGLRCQENLENASVRIKSLWQLGNHILPKVVPLVTRNIATGKTAIVMIAHGKIPHMGNLSTGMFLMWEDFQGKNCHQEFCHTVYICIYSLFIIY